MAREVKNCALPIVPWLFEGEEFTGEVIYTGAIDELFSYEYGHLPYRSLNFKFEHYDKMNKVEVVIMIVDPLSGGHNGNSEDHLPPSVKFLFK